MSSELSLLESVNSPADLKALPPEAMPQLAQEIRSFLIRKVSATGGHLGPNLGVVEITMALHRVFDSPHDALIFDTGHQSYVHKIVTGRRDGFDALRKRNGLSGYPSRDESEHDWVENSHASTALSYADGLAKSRDVLPDVDRGHGHVVAVVGDGSLTGGMAWEAINNIASGDRSMVIIVNDNARSYSPTIGGVADRLATLRGSDRYEKFMDWGKRTLGRTPVVGAPMYDTLHGMKKGLKDMVAPQGLFEDLGVKYLGPVDGHDTETLERHLAVAKAFDGPVIVQAITEKGHGFGPAERDEADRFHGIGVINPETGIPTKKAGTTWTSIFSNELVKVGERRKDIVAITAAMAGPTGLQSFADRFPDRCFDVGIAEQHALTSAAGLAMGGAHPVVAVYSTFLNRAYDQVLFDVAAHKLPVTIILDRAGVTGEDGPSHNGMWDLAMMAGVPGVRVAAPRDAETLKQDLHEAFDTETGPTVVRFPKGQIADPIPPLRQVGSVDVIAELGDDTLVVAMGAMVAPALEAAKLLKADGVRVSVVDPGWILPTSDDLIGLVAAASSVVTIEDGLVVGGVGSAIAATAPTVPVLNLGIPKVLLSQATRQEILSALQLDAAGIAESTQKWVYSLRAH